MTTVNCESTSNENIEMSIIFKVEHNYGSNDSIYIFNLLFRNVMEVLKLCQMNRNYYNPKAAVLIPRYK